MPTTATTQATPMMMPSAVRSDRSLLRERARKATLRIFPVLVTVLSRPAGERLVEDFQRLVHLAGAHDERRGDADDVAVEAAFADQEAAFLRLLEEPDGLFGRGRSVLNGLVGHELESLHEAHAAHVAERLRVFRLQPVEAGPQAPAHLGGAFRRVHLLHDLESGERGGRGDRVPSERRDRERLEGVRDLRRRDRDAERHPVRDPFGHRHDLGLDVPVRDAEPRAAGAPEARLHLVADEDAAVLPHDADRDLEVLFRGRDESADALDGLCDEARDLTGRRRLELIKTTTTGQIAGFIAEPIQGVGGFITPPKEYFEIAVGIVRKYGGVFICDEVQTGFGRTGGSWLGITIATPEVADSLKALTISTFGGNPISSAAALATLEVMEEMDAPKRAAEMGGRLRAGLDRLKAKYPKTLGDVRGMGLMQGLELVADETVQDRTPAPEKAVRLFEETKKRGLLIGKGGLYGNVIRISPPLIVSAGEVDEALKILDESLAGWA